MNVRHRDVCRAPPSTRNEVGVLLPASGSRRFDPGHIVSFASDVAKSAAQHEHGPVSLQSRFAGDPTHP
jgi:hypothetical protein